MDELSKLHRATDEQREQVLDLEHRLVDARTALAAVVADRDTAQAGAVDALTQLNARRAAVTAAEGDAQAARREAAQLRADADALRSERESLQGSVGGLRGERATLEVRLQSCRDEAEVAAALTRCGALASALSALVAAQTWHPRC